MKTDSKNSEVWVLNFGNEDLRSDRLQACEANLAEMADISIRHSPQLGLQR